MTGSQWFQLWLAIGQVLGGLVAVLIAARLAFAFARRQRTEDRSRLAAEKLAFALGTSIQELFKFIGAIKFVIEPAPENLEDAMANGVDPIAIAKEVRTAFDAVSAEAALLSSEELRERVQWIGFCFTDFSLMTAALRSNTHRFTMIELADTASKACDAIAQVQSSLHHYARGEIIQPMDKPTYWRSPVGEISNRIESNKLSWQGTMN